MTDEEQKELSISLFNAGTFKYGTFYTKTECQLNSYFDLLAVLGNPSLMDKICDQSSKLCKDGNIDFNSLCGVTYGGMPFAVLMALKLQKPLLMWRKEISCHPNQPRIIGKIAENEYCLVVEEVTCSGNSILEVIKDIEDTGMLVRDVFTIIDLEQGASENFKKLGYNLHSLIKMSRLAQILYDENLISADRRKSICEGFSSIFAPNGDCITGTNLGIKKSMPYEARIDLCKSKVAQKLFKLMLRKKSNLSVDFTTNKLDTLVHVADIIGPFICILVLHLDVFEDFEETKFHNLKRIATKHDFLIMDDRKISEYEDVMKVQCSKIFKFVDLLTIHAICGEVTMRTIQSLATKFPENGVFIVTYPNCSNSLLTAGYEKNAINATVEFFEEASGFMCWKISEVPLGYVHMVLDNNKISKTNSKRIKNTICYPSDTLVSEICADIVLSYYDELENIEELVKKKQSLLWNAYLKRVNMNIVR